MATTNMNLIDRTLTPSYEAYFKTRILKAQMQDDYASLLDMHTAHRVFCGPDITAKDADDAVKVAEVEAGWLEKAGLFGMARAWMDLAKFGRMTWRGGHGYAYNG